MCESSSLMPPSPSPEYKHFCRVCNKGFTCGSALGGHMRAHGAGDDGFGADDDPLGDEPARCRGSDDQWDAVGTSATHAYALRANPNRLIRSCQVCKNCGNEFTSWELFLEHGKCNSDDEDGGELRDGSPHLSSPPSDADREEDPAVAAGWSKGKRSRRVKLMTAVDDPSPAVPSRRCTSGEEEDLANCLVMLSSSNVEQATVAKTDQQEPCASVSKEGDRGPPLLQPISFLAPAPEPVTALPSAIMTTTQYAAPAPRGLFECKACKKVFTSHQALGGHRASHKKVKGCFAARIENSATETPSHVATADPSNDNGKAAVADATTEPNANASADARTNVDATTAIETNAGTSEAAPALSMALAPVVHEPPVTALTMAAPSKKNTKLHECSVCHRLFTSGQALGGHKRCHWLTSSSTDPTNPVANLTVPPLTEDLVGVVRHQLILRPMVDTPEPALDLTIAAVPAVRAEAGSGSFHLDATVAPVHFQSPVGPSNASHRNKTSTTGGHDGIDTATASVAAEDEADSTTVKRARLKDVVSMDGEDTTPWLQVGIGSSSAGGDDKSTRE